MRKKIEDQVEMLRAYEYQKELKAEKEAARAVEEAEFRKKLLAKFAEDDRIELLNEQKKRQKMIIHKREVERLIEEKRKIYAAEREADIRSLAEQRVEEEKRQVVVEEEKSRLLREHAADYYDYLPKGMFQKTEDFEFVRDKAMAAKAAEREAELGA